jgi:hypothetical protein
MSMTRAVAGALVAGALACATGHAADSPRQREVLLIDGVRVSFERKLLPGRAIDRLLAQAEAWERENPEEPVVRSRTADWHIVGQRNGGEFRTAQFRDTDVGVDVATAFREWGARRAPLNLPMALPRNTHVVRTIETVGEEPSVLQIVAEARVTPRALIRQLERSASTAGWRIEPAATGAKSGVTVWRREADELMAVVATSRTGTSLLLHVVRRARITVRAP